MASTPSEDSEGGGSITHSFFEKMKSGHILYLYLGSGRVGMVGSISLRFVDEVGGRWGPQPPSFTPKVENGASILNSLILQVKSGQDGDSFRHFFDEGVNDGD